MATEEDVLKVLAYMAAVWPRVELSDATVAAYTMHLLHARVTLDALLLAAMRLVETSEFLPSIAALLAQVRQIEARWAAYTLTANYRQFGHDLPEELMLPPGFAALVLENESVLVLEAGN